MKLAAHSCRMAGIALIAATAIATTPSVSRPVWLPSSLSSHTIQLAGETRPFVIGTDQPLRLFAVSQELSPLRSSAMTTPSTSDVVSLYDTLDPWVDYSASLALWAGRFLPVSGALLYHSSVAYAYLIDPMVYSIVHNLANVIDGNVSAEQAFANIAQDLAMAIVDVISAEIAGHSALLPPAQTPGGGTEQWVQWVQWGILATIAPLYYFPVPNAVTIDQLSFLGQFVGTVINSVVTQFGQVVNGTIPVDQALTNVIDTINNEAVPRFVLNEQILFTAPSPPVSDIGEADWSQVHDPGELLVQLVIHSVGVVLQEVNNPLPILRQIASNGVGDLQVLAAGLLESVKLGGAEPTVTAVASIANRTFAHLQAVLHVVQSDAPAIGQAIINAPAAIGTELAAGAESVRAALGTQDPLRVVDALGQGTVRVATAALGQLHIAGELVETFRTDVATALDDPPAVQTRSNIAAAIPATGGTAVEGATPTLAATAKVSTSKRTPTVTSDPAKSGRISDLNKLRAVGVFRHATPNSPSRTGLNRHSLHTGKPAA